MPHSGHSRHSVDHEHLANKEFRHPLDILAETTQTERKLERIQKSLIHELVVSDRLASYLKTKHDGLVVDFQRTLEKVAVEKDEGFW